MTKPTSICLLLGHKWATASIGPRTVATIQCERCGRIRFGMTLKRQRRRQEFTKNREGQ